jgi:type VI secretion system secreted protein Hcp
MHSKRSTLTSTLVLSFLGLAGAALAPAAPAQSLDTFMRIDGIPGESLASGHINDIILTSYSQSFAPGKACSKVVAQKFMDRSSPALISRAAANLILPSVIISIRKTGGVPFDFFRAVLESVSIEKVDVSGESGRLIEQVVLRPRNIRIEYRQQDATGQPAQTIVTNIDCN